MKPLAKRLANLVALVQILPAWALYRLGSLIFGPTRAFFGWSQTFSLFPGFFGVYLRRAFYRLILPHCGIDSWIGFGTLFSHPTAELGHRAHIGNYCSIGDVTLEDDVLLGSHVSIMNGGSQHGIGRLDVPIREQAGAWPRITIGRDTWIGERCIVLADIGRFCVIGAGSIVTRPIPDYAVAVGAPARIVRYRCQPTSVSPLTETVRLGEV